MAITGRLYDGFIEDFHEIVWKNATPPAAANSFQVGRRRLRGWLAHLGC
jgi:hypothetical protein